MVSVAPTSPASHGMTRDILRLLGDVIRAKPWPFAALALILVVGNARTGLYVAALGGLTQALIDRDQQQAITWAAVFLGAGIVEQLYWPFRNHLRTLLLDHATLRIQRRVLTRAADVPLEAFEDGPFFSRLQRANDNLGQHVANAIERVQDVAQVVIMFAAILVPLWLVHPAIVLFLLLGCVPSFVTQYRTARVVHDAVQRHAMTDRLADRLATLLVDRNVGVELRLFGNGPMLMRRWLDARRTIADAVLSAEGTKLRGSLLGEAGIAIGLAGTIFFVVRLLLAERAPIGSWVSVVIGIEWSLQMVAGLAVVTRAVREEGAYLGDLFVFEDTADAISATHRQESPDVASSVVAHSDGAMKIVADHVSFSYPGAGRPVIRDVSLTLSPGERVAIVGENGAGKSTLVRLLTGLYVPDCGKVTQDDVDTASDAAASLRPQIGAVFQDFVAWQLTLRENIGMSALSRIDDDPALRDAAAKAGLLDLVDTLPERLDTWLGREFGDRDLSGGQWQRVALARAFFRDSRLLVMDEPTAALDPLAEQRLFERFAALAHGRTALTISHRLGPARFADRIIVMDAGRIVESGDHDALMAMGGRYARMFKAQSEWYNDHRHTDVPVA